MGIFDQGTSGNVVLGNRIGTDKNGTGNLGNANTGVLIEGGATANTVGGTAAGAGNTIAFNASGVVLNGTATVRNAILRNSIFGNTGLGIALGSPPANHGQKAPRLTALSATATGTTVKGSLASSPGTYRVEFFASPSTGPIFQGKTYLGFINVTVPAGGTVAFTAAGLAGLPGGSVVTATATNSTSGASKGDTSRFSKAVTPALVVSVTPSFGIFHGSQKITLSAQVHSGPTRVNGGVVTFSIVPAGGGPAIKTFTAVVVNGMASKQFTMSPTTKPGPYNFVAVYHDPRGFFADVKATSSTRLVFFNQFGTLLLAFV